MTMERLGFCTMDFRHPILKLVVCFILMNWNGISRGGLISSKVNLQGRRRLLISRITIMWQALRIYKQVLRAIVSPRVLVTIIRFIVPIRISLNGIYSMPMETWWELAQDVKIRSYGSTTFLLGYTSFKWEDLWECSARKSSSLVESNYEPTYINSLNLFMKKIILSCMDKIFITEMKV